MPKPFWRKCGVPVIPKGGTVEEQPLAFIHPCHVEGCEAPAPFGYGVSLLRGKPGTWACADHRLEEMAGPDDVESHDHSDLLA